MATLADTHLPDDGTLRDELKSRLGVSGSDSDAQITGIVTAAVYLGDYYLQREFVDDDGADETHPITLIEGVYAAAAQIWRDAEQGEPVATSIKTGPFEIDRSVTLLQGSPILRAALPYWRPHARGLWRRGDSLL